MIRFVNTTLFTSTPNIEDNGLQYMGNQLYIDRAGHLKRLAIGLPLMTHLVPMVMTSIDRIK
jgi:hypothetical protein